MLIPLGPSSAAAVTSSPNTQLIKVRLVMQPAATAVTVGQLGAYFVAMTTGGP